MKDLKTLMESGILELYVSGNATPAEVTLVEEMAASSIEIQDELAAISDALELLAMNNSVTPGPAVKPFLMAAIDYTERLKNGEAPSVPPNLHEHSSPNDFSSWLDRPDMTLPEDFEEFHAKIIGYTPQAITAIAWIKSMAPQEVHDDEHEKFLILEGTCDITIDSKVHHLTPGDYLSIPLHAAHHVTVTSSYPCKVILQRVAA